MTDPLVALAGTRVVSWVALSWMKSALTPLKRTDVAPPRLVPVMITACPGRAEATLSPVMAGAPLLVVTVKFADDVAVPPGVVTVMDPLAPPTGTVAVIWVALFTVKAAALVPLNETAVAPVRLVPVMVSADPTNPEVGLKLLMVGTEGSTVKEATLVAVPPAVVTVIEPVVAPTGTVVPIWLDVLDVSVAANPLNFTEALPRFEPLMVTATPGAAESGANPLMIGAGVGAG